MVYAQFRECSMRPGAVIRLCTDWALSKYTSRSTCLLNTEALSFNSEHKATLCKRTAVFHCITSRVLPGHVNLQWGNKVGRASRWWAQAKSQTNTMHLLNTAVVKATLAAIYARTAI